MHVDREHPITYCPCNTAPVDTCHCYNLEVTVFFEIVQTYYITN